ncbi:broad-complex core protein isoforms 1/2/3/4/5-like [Cydia amplana]|uniref:broad-complex core protein isoforms 1/2/3/4/5-like n=1 Tax=Cydia amplana TaxID=1869771 RepID=UPI002FE5D543
MPNNYALSLSSSTYKNHIFEGFSSLQQNDEFVDMTLAAEGHWVKVHRTLVALASPYFRELLHSLPCQHPVMYLYGVSHEALGFILEYIYTGQVEIPAEKVKSFLHTARDMQIAGLKNVVPPDENEAPRQEKQSKQVFLNDR